jgi:FkbM family methyltransferase
MVAHVDPAPYGAHAPDRFVRAMMAITRRLPASWLGLRVSMPWRRLAINHLGERPIDTTVWNARVRLYPAHNICEKTALFTPQMFDVRERAALAAAIERCVAAGRTFTFVDIGANAGLYSLYVAERAGPHARVLAIEPQPGIVERLTFNLACNPGFNAVARAVAVAGREGTVGMVVDPRDSGGTHLALDADETPAASTVEVRCRPLRAILEDAGINAIDALKIDIEGAEHLALAPLLRAAPDDLLPRLVIIEDRRWPIDLYALMEQRGYVKDAGAGQNLILRRGSW